MTKAEIRAEMQAKKRSLCAEQIASASRRLLAQLVSHPLYSRCTCIYCYLSFNQEVQTLPILLRALSDGKQLAAPVIREQRMQFVTLTEPTAVRPGRWGIPEPIAAAPIATAPSALVLVPGLAFTESGDRIGYGGGYYDRFLSLEPQHPTIALCYDFQLFPTLPTQAFDRRVDVVLHEGV